MASAPGTQQATARIRFDSWSEFARFMNQDGGSRGLFVRAAVPPPIGTELTVHFVLPDGSDLALPGRVAHRLSAEEAQGHGRASRHGRPVHAHVRGASAARPGDHGDRRVAAVDAHRDPTMQNNSTAPGMTRPTPVNQARAVQPTAAAPVARPAAPAQNGNGAAAKPVNGASAAAVDGTKRPIAGAVSGAPQDPRLHQAASMLERGRFDLAQRKVAELLEDNPDLIARRSSRRDRRAPLRAQFAFEEAIERYRAVLRLDPEHGEARDQLAVLPHELEHSVALYTRMFGTRPE